MRKLSKYISLALAVLMAFAMFAACKADVEENKPQTGTVGDVSGETTDSTSGTTAETTEDTADEGGEASTTTEAETDGDASKPEVDPDPQFDGVYTTTGGMIVIRYADEEMCDFIVSFGGSVEEAYVSGIAQISGNEILYQTESYAMTMTLNYDELVVEEEGANPYSATGFAGTYTRSEHDPYSIEARPTVGAAQSPDVTGYAIVNGAKAILYVDPESRFTATVPDVFSDRPEDKQPETGVYFGSIDNDVYALIEVTADGGISAEELKKGMETEYGVEADLFVNGMVTVTYTYTVDGEEWIGHIYACVLDDQLVRIEYCYVADQDAYFSTLLDQISINIS